MRLRITLVLLALLAIGASAANPELYLHKKGDLKGAEAALEVSPQWYLRAGASFDTQAKTLSVPVSLLYKVPGRVAIWSFYGGAGASWSRESEQVSPFIVGGTEFLFLYTEYQFSMEKNSEPTLRGGFHFRF